MQTLEISQQFRRVVCELLRHPALDFNGFIFFTMQIGASSWRETRRAQLDSLSVRTTDSFLSILVRVERNFLYQEEDRPFIKRSLNSNPGNSCLSDYYVCIAGTVYVKVQYLAFTFSLHRKRNDLVSKRQTDLSWWGKPWSLRSSSDHLQHPRERQLPLAMDLSTDRPFGSLSRSLAVFLTIPGRFSNTQIIRTVLYLI